MVQYLYSEKGRICTHLMRVSNVLDNYPEIGQSSRLVMFVTNWRVVGSDSGSDSVRCTTELTLSDSVGHRT